MIVLGLVAALFTIFLAGFGVALWMFARGDRINLIECACLAWLLGCGIVSLLLWFCGMFCSGLLLQAIVTVRCLLVAVVGCRAQRNANATFDLPKPANIADWNTDSLMAIE